MGKSDFLDKKHHGDASRIRPVINAKREALGKKPYSIRMINAMLSGERKMPDYVAEIISRYYSFQEELIGTNQ